MCLDMKEAPLIFSGRRARGSVTFDGPVRNVEAMLRGCGARLRAVVNGNRVDFAARLPQGERCLMAAVVVMADRVEAV